jgi:hypothetical protein
MRLPVLVGLLMALAIPAFADLTIEYSGTMNMLPMLEEGTARMTTRIETRRDRSRLTRWGTDAKAPRNAPEDTTIEIIREDKHLRWEIDLKDRTYMEYAWPDTALPMPRADLEAQARSAMPDSVRQRMESLKDLVTEVRPTGEHTTMHGYPVEHFIIESRLRNRPKDFQPGLDFGALHDIWITKDVPHLDQVQEHLSAFNRRSDLSHPSYDEDPKAHGEDGVLPGSHEKLDGLPIRYIARMKMMDSTGIAEYAKERASASPDSARERDPLEESFDPETGSIVLMDMELTLLSQDPIDDLRFEIPPGYKKEVWPPITAPPKPKAKTTRSHSPR